MCVFCCRHINAVQGSQRMAVEMAHVRHNMVFELGFPQGLDLPVL